MADEPLVERAADALHRRMAAICQEPRPLPFADLPAGKQAFWRTLAEAAVDAAANARGNQ